MELSPARELREIPATTSHYHFGSTFFSVFLQIASKEGWGNKDFVWVFFYLESVYK